MSESISDTYVAQTERLQRKESGTKELVQDMPAYYVQRGDGYDGPHTAEALSQLITAGEIQEKSLIWKEGMPEWKSYAQVFRAASTPPPLPTQSPEFMKNKEEINKTNLLFNTVSKLDSLWVGP